MGLLIVQILNAVFDLAQKHISLGQRIGGGGGHEVGLTQALQGSQGGARAQLGEVAPAHHLQQLHRELNFTNAAARQLHIIGPFRTARALGDGIFANLLVQSAQRLKHAVVQVAAKHKRQHGIA